MEPGIYQAPKSYSVVEEDAIKPIFEEDAIYMSPNSKPVPPWNSTKFPYNSDVYNNDSITSNSVLEEDAINPVFEEDAINPVFEEDAIKPVFEEDATYMSPNSNPVSPWNSTKFPYNSDVYNNDSISSNPEFEEDVIYSVFEEDAINPVFEEDAIYISPNSIPVYPSTKFPYNSDVYNNDASADTRLKKVQAAIYTSSNKTPSTTTTSKTPATNQQAVSSGQPPPSTPVCAEAAVYMNPRSGPGRPTSYPPRCEDNIYNKTPTKQSKVQAKVAIFNSSPRFHDDATADSASIKKPFTQSARFPKPTNQSARIPRPANRNAEVPKPTNQQKEDGGDGVYQIPIENDVSIYMIPATPSNPDSFAYDLAADDDDEEEDIYVEPEHASVNSRTSSIATDDVVDSEEDNYIDLFVTSEPTAVSSMRAGRKAATQTRRRTSLSPLKPVKWNTVTSPPVRKASAPHIGEVGKNSSSKFTQVLRHLHDDRKRQEQGKKKKNKKKNQKEMGNSISKGRSLWKDKEQAQRVGPEHIHVLHQTTGSGVRNYHKQTASGGTARPPPSASSTLSSTQPSPTMPRVPPPQPPLPTATSSVEVNGMRPLPPTPHDPTDEEHPDTEQSEINSIPPCPPPPAPRDPNNDDEEDPTEESVYLMPEIRVASSVPAERRALPLGSGCPTPLFTTPRASPGSSRHGSGKSAMSNFSDLSSSDADQTKPPTEKKTPPMRPIDGAFVKKTAPHRGETVTAFQRKVQRAKTQHDKPTRPALAAAMTSQQKSMTSSSVQRSAQTASSLSSQLSRNRSFPAAAKPNTSAYLTPKSPAPKKPSFKPIPPPPPAGKSLSPKRDPPVSSSSVASPSRFPPSPKKGPDPPSPPVEDNEYEIPKPRVPPVRPPPPSETSIKRAILLREARREKKNYLQRNGKERVKSPIRKHQSFYQVRPNLLQQLEQQNAIEDETYQSIEPLQAEPNTENGQVRQRNAAASQNHGFSANLISKTSKTTKNIKSSLVAKAGKIKKKYLSPRKSPTLDGAKEPPQAADDGEIELEDSIYSGIDDVTIDDDAGAGNEYLGAEEGIYLTADV